MKSMRMVVGAVALMLAATSVHAEIHINSATWGVAGGDGRVTDGCDATKQMAQACDGKVFCQVYADNRSLCNNPSNKWKVLEVAYTCGGAEELLSFPETAQALLRCEASPEPTGIVTSSDQPAAAEGIPGHVWRVTEGDPSWQGVWTRRGDSNTFDVVNTRSYGGEVQHFTVTMEVSGDTVTINRNGQFYNGTLSADRKSASGSATWYAPGTQWHATIE